MDEEAIEKMLRFIRYVANDQIELSHDKIRWQRDDFMREARRLLKWLNGESDATTLDRKS